MNVSRERSFGCMPLVKQKPRWQVAVHGATPGETRGQREGLLSRFAVGAAYGLLSSAAVLTLRSVRTVAWHEQADEPVPAGARADEPVPAGARADEPVPAGARAAEPALEVSASSPRGGRRRRPAAPPP